MVLNKHKRDIIRILAWGPGATSPPTPQQDSPIQCGSPPGRAAGEAAATARSTESSERIWNFMIAVVFVVVENFLCLGRK